ncbi:sensor histidine kinase [Caulobacter sp. UC70_42]|uniref:sensor histidine kinase n=1 Tax=Caulobacter sp. UC70_42 TaxID=3374551 RepID=UPI00375638E5
MSDPKPGVTPEQLATLSHEFRTPLNGVLGMARLLENTKLTAEQRSYVTALRESGDHLLSLVNDVLHFARLGAASIELSLAPVDIEGLLRQVAELMSPRAHEKGVEIAWAVPTPLPTIQADEGRLRQILLNFAGNAVKFTEAGGVLLTATATAPPQGEEGGRIRFSVADTGPGVAPDARRRIFDAFVQTDITHATQLGGAGLGLAIVSTLAKAMNGEVGVGGELGQGAEFWFEAPFEVAAPALRASPLEGRAVAIASPNAIVRAATARQIEAAGGPRLRRRRHRLGPVGRAGRRRAADRRGAVRATWGVEAPNRSQGRGAANARAARPHRTAEDRRLLGLSDQAAARRLAGGPGAAGRRTRSDARRRDAP